MPTLSERIKTKQAEVQKLRDDLAEATKALDEGDEDAQEAALGVVEQLTADLEAATKSLDALVRAEKALAARAAEADTEEEMEGGDGNNGPPVKKNYAAAPVHSTKANKTPLWLRQAVCEFCAFVERKTVKQVMEERYPEAKNKDLHAVYMIQKTAVPLATTFTTGWAAELVQDDIRGFLNILQAVSAAAALALRGMNMNFDGFNSVTVPSRKPRNNTTNNMSGAFVGEGGAIPLGRLELGAQSMGRYKMGVISTFSRELAERSTPSIEAVIRQAVLDDMAWRLDTVVFGSGAAVPGIQPAGLLNGVVAIPGAAGGGPDALTADVKALVTALAASGGATGIVIFMNDLDAVGINFMTNALGEFMFNTASGQLLTFSLVVSENISQGSLIGVIAPNIATAFDATDFNVSDVATVVEANADAVAPTHATGAAGAIGTADQVPQNGGIPVAGGTGAAAAGATARSLWQTYSIGIRAVQPVSWGMMRAGSAAYVDNITWGAA